MARLLDMVEALIDKIEVNRELLMIKGGEYGDLKKTSEYSSLEELANDLADIQDALTSLIDFGTISLVAKRSLKQSRYCLATYLDPICCVCSEGPARYTNDAWYCEKCVEVEK